MYKKIKNIDALDFSRLPEHKSRLISMPDGSPYKDEPLLSEAHRMSNLAFPVPAGNYDNPCAYDWFGCDIFGTRYTNGRINGLSGRQFDALKDKFCLDPLREKYPDHASREADPKAYKKDLKLSIEHFHYDILKPIEDKDLGDMLERFKSVEIIASLLALNIDPVLFWYALVWLKDFIDDKTDSAIEYEDTPLESFEQMVMQLQSITDVLGASQEDYDKWLDASASGETVEGVTNGELTLKVDGMRKMTVSNPVTLRILGQALSDYVEKYSDSVGTDEYYALHNLREARNEDDRTDSPLFPKAKKLYVPYLTKIFLFHKYMKAYLADYSGEKNLSVSDVITGTQGREGNSVASVDKEWLISRLVWVIGYGDKKRFYDNPKGVKDALKGFNDSIVRKLYSNDYSY
jgi:hypothetical protein